jgi:hypothetical protein
MNAWRVSLGGRVFGLWPAVAGRLVGSVHGELGRRSSSDEAAPNGLERLRTWALLGREGEAPTAPPRHCGVAALAAAAALGAPRLARGSAAAVAPGRGMRLGVDAGRASFEGEGAITILEADGSRLLARSSAVSGGAGGSRAAAARDADGGRDDAPDVSLADGGAPPALRPRLRAVAAEDAPMAE